jgi:hypothetical protein
MYASAWIFVSAPTVVSFSMYEPRPRDDVVADVDRSAARRNGSAEDHAARSASPRRRRAGRDRSLPSADLVGGQRLALSGRARQSSVGGFPTTRALPEPSRPPPSTVPSYPIAVVDLRH